MTDDVPDTAPGAHGYHDWQVSTLMLAYDVREPADRHDMQTLQARQTRAEQEVHEIAMSVIPQAYKDDPQLEFPPSLVIDMTRETLRRAARSAGLDLPQETGAQT